MVELGERAFEGEPHTTTITIGDGITTIGSRAFADCVDLTSVTLPAGLTDIGDQAFFDGSSLEVILILFQGDAPTLGGTSVFTGAVGATAYYTAATSGWGAPTFGGLPAALWTPGVGQIKTITPT